MGGLDDGRRRIWTAAGVALLIAAGGLSLLRNADETTSYAVGGAFGAVALGLLLGAALRWLWVRFGSGTKPVLDRSRWLLTAGVAALVASFATAANEARESEETLERATEAIERGLETCPVLRTGSLGEGLTLRVPPPALVRRLESLAAQSPAPTEFGEAASFYLVEGSGIATVVLSSIPIDLDLISEEGGEDQFRDDALAGARDAAIDQGSTPEPVEVAGEEAVGTQTLPREYRIVALSGCKLLTAFGADRDETAAALEAVIGNAVSE